MNKTDGNEPRSNTRWNLENRPHHKEGHHRQPNDQNGDGRNMGEKFQKIRFEQTDRGVAMVDRRVGHG